MKTKVIGLTLAVCLFLTISPILAAENPPLTEEAYQVAAFDQLLVNRYGARAGVQEIFKVDGQILLALNFTFKVGWTEALKKLKVKPEEITLTPEGGEPLKMCGKFRNYGLFQLQSAGISASRPSNWRKKAKLIHYNVVFAVPPGTAKAVFKAGGFSREIDIPAEIKPAPKAAETIQIKILAAGLVDSAPMVSKVAGQKLGSTLLNPDGALLKIRFSLQPTRPNGTSPDHYFWHTSWLGILCDQGYPGAVVGETHMKSLSTNVSHNSNKSKNKGFSAREYTAYFSVPRGVKSFKLTFANEIVAEGNL